jgi:hypothetical protein
MTDFTVGYGPFDAPTGTTVAGVLFTATDSTGATIASQALAALATAVSVTFPAAGVYALSAQAVDAAGNHIGPAATGTYTVAAPSTVTVQIPTSIVAA